MRRALPASPKLSGLLDDDGVSAMCSMAMTAADGWLAGG